MAKGLAIPVGVDQRGGAALVEGDDHSEAIMLLALNDDDNEHAWQQDIGIGVDMIFDNKSMGLRARIMARVNSIFRRFEALELYKLVQDSVAWSEEEGELILDFKYVNLESDETKSFSRRFSSSTSAAR